MATRGVVILTRGFRLGAPGRVDRRSQATTSQLASVAPCVRCVAEFARSGLTVLSHEQNPLARSGHALLGALRLMCNCTRCAPNAVADRRIPESLSSTLAGFAIRRRREKSLLGAIMVTTGAKEPSHTLPAEVDVTQAVSQVALRCLGGRDLGKLGRNAWPRMMTASRAAAGSLWLFAPANCSCSGLRGGTNVKMGHSSSSTDAICVNLRMTVPPGAAD
jgi:hypothetical protein